jgi:hypothetical protein
MKIRRAFSLAGFFLLMAIVSLQAMADDYVENGTYNATVTTNSGTYTVPVEVEGGEVTEVHWPNGGDMTVDGAEIDSGEASGHNSRGDYISIEIDE